MVADKVCLGFDSCGTNYSSILVLVDATVDVDIIDGVASVLDDDLVGVELLVLVDSGVDLAVFVGVSSNNTLGCELVSKPVVVGLDALSVALVDARKSFALLNGIKSQAGSGSCARSVLAAVAVSMFVGSVLALYLDVIVLLNVIVLLDVIVLLVVIAAAAVTVLAAASVTTVLLK